MELKKKRILELSSAFVKMSLEVTLTAKKVLRTNSPKIICSATTIIHKFLWEAKSTAN